LEQHLNSLGFISSIVRRYSEDNKDRFYQEPDSSGEPLVACWQAWAASRYLEMKGEWQRAISWIGKSCELLPDNESSKDTLLNAEVLGLAGRLIYVQGDVGDALPLLVQSGTLWNALAASAKTEFEVLERLADDIRGMLTAFDPERTILPEKARAQTRWLVDTWPDECMLDSWSKLAATQGRALAAAGRFQEARAAILAMKNSLRVAYYLPALPERRDDLMGLAERTIDRGREDRLDMGGLPPTATSGSHAVVWNKEKILQYFPRLSPWSNALPIAVETKERMDVAADYLSGGPEAYGEESEVLGPLRVGRRSKPDSFSHLRKQTDEITRGDDKVRVLVCAVVPLWRLAMAHGDVEVAAGAFGASVEEFEFAVRVWDDHVVNYEDVHCVAQALFNQANSYLQLERYEEARQNYAKCIKYFGLYDFESTLRARHADLVARWRLNPQEDVEAEAREMVTEWETILRSKPDRRNLHISKAALCPLYGLMLSLLARRSVPAATLEYFDILRASREGHELTSSREIRVVASGESERHFRVEAARSLELVREYLPRFPRMVIMFLQNGAGELTYLALRGGSDAGGNFDEEQLLGVAPTELSTIFGELLDRQQAELELISSGRASEYQPPSPEFSECCAHTWQLLPEKLRNWLDAAETIVFCPDPSGNLDKIPFELFRTGNGWLGVDHRVTRYVSIRDLMKMLSADGPSKPLGGRAAIVQAEGPVDFVPLPDADREVDQVLRYFELIGLKGERTRPKVANVVEVLDGDYRILHYCGHGLATALGEGLPLAPGESIARKDAEAQGIHPACWGVYALYGDPSTIISPLVRPTK
jgi:tetratricopeptide (TPR) repeat protein